MTVHVYVLPVVTPAMVTGLVAVTPVSVEPPSLDVHVAVNCGEVSAPPLSAPGANDIRNDPVAVVVDIEPRLRPVGAAGDPTTTAFEAAELGPAPTSLVDLTVHV